GTADSFEILHQQLVERKEAISHQFFQESEMLSSMVEHLAESSQWINDLPIQNQDFRAFEGGLRRVYGSGRRRMKLAYKIGDSPEKFHNWRKRVKDLWYQMEFLQPLWPAVLGVTAIELHWLSDYLGDAHDAAVLADYIEENQGALADEVGVVALPGLLYEYRRKLEQKAQPLGLRLYAEEPEDFGRRMATYWGVWQQYGAEEREALPG
ncbi:MAG: CHAD domain-containing protein, partial [Candidatus Promineifilaceae bacterium]